MNNELSHGEFVLLSDLTNEDRWNQYVDQTVRVVGKLDAYDTQKQIAIVLDEGNYLVVKTDIITDFKFELDTLTQFIGVVSIKYNSLLGKSEVRLLARVASSKKLMDLALYKEAWILAQRSRPRRVMDTSSE